MSKVLLFACLALILFAGCSATLPSVDWCFRFDFRASNYGFAAVLGSWVNGTGFIPNDDGQIKLTYIHSGAVTPQAIIITAARNGVAGLPIRVAGRADIFGKRVNSMETVVPENVSTGTFYVVTNQGPGSSDKVEMTAEASLPIALQTMEVRGNGSNPFSANNCSTAAISNEGITVPGIDIPGNLPGAIVEADDALADVDVPLTSPDGQPLLPAFNPAQVFGYAKWITSGAAAEELGGPFAGIFSHMGIYVGMNIALTAIYGVIYAVVYAIRWIIWIVRFILQLIRTVVAALVAIPILLIALKVIAILSVIVAIGTAIALLFDALTP